MASIFRLNGLVLVVGILCCFAKGSFAADLPDLEQDSLSGLGVNIHTSAAKYPTSFDMMKEAGVKIVRTNLYWGRVEKTKGEYVWSHYDDVVQKIAGAGARPLFVLSFSNKLYADMYSYKQKKGKGVGSTALPPITQEGLAGFSAFAEAAVRHYKDSQVIWEIWNEPDYVQFWRPIPNGADYARLASAACLAIKKADPEAIVVGPASAGTPSEDNRIEWWLPFLKSPAMDCLDAISVHPYVRNTNKGPEINSKKYARLRQLIAERTPRKIPIISTEFGFSTTDWNVFPERQAALFVRNYMVNLMENVPVSIWYDWRDDGRDPKNREHNFGIVTKDEWPKPVFYAAKTLSTELSGYKFNKRERLPKGEKNGFDDEVFVLSFTHPEKPRALVVWTTESRLREISLPVEGSSVIVVDMFGETTPYSVEKGTISLKVNEKPQYVLLQK
ncbi:MAG: cellulase family glycosylhydrolase [Bdellovibrionales bacterium]